jgi:hypothetical protein
MLIHLQNSYALRSKQGTGRREAQSRGSGPQSKNSLCIFKVCILLRVYIYYVQFYRQRNNFLLLNEALHVSTTMGHPQVLQVSRIQLLVCSLLRTTCTQM